MPHKQNTATVSWSLGVRDMFLMAFQPYLVSTEAFNEGISLLHASIHDQGNPHCQTTQDFLVLCLLSIAYHVLDGLGRLRAQHDQTQGQARSFTWEFKWYCQQGLFWVSSSFFFLISLSTQMVFFQKENVHTRTVFRFYSKPTHQ